MTAPLRSRARRSTGARPAPVTRRVSPARVVDLTDRPDALSLTFTTAPDAPDASGGPAVRPLRPTAPAGPPPPLHQLGLALTDLDEVFAIYPYRATMPICGHCVSPAEHRALGRAPAQIPGPVLDRFVTKVLVTWGDVPDLKHLLPEILARTCDGRLGPPPALVGARLRRAGWGDWPAAETPAVRRALRAAWAATLEAMPGPGCPPVSRTLSLLAAAEDDLVPYLDMWEDRLEAPGDPGARLGAVLHLADLLSPLATGGRRRLARSLPLARRSTIGQIDQWLRQPVVVQRLAHAAESLRSTPHHQRMTHAREGLAHLRTER